MQLQVCKVFPFIKTLYILRSPSIRTTTDNRELRTDNRDPSNLQIKSKLKGNVVLKVRQVVIAIPVGKT